MIYLFFLCYTVIFILFIYNMIYYFTYLHITNIYMCVCVHMCVTHVYTHICTHTQINIKRVGSLGPLFCFSTASSKSSSSCGRDWERERGKKKKRRRRKKMIFFWIFSFNLQVRFSYNSILVFSENIFFFF